MSMRVSELFVSSPRAFALGGLLLLAACAKHASPTYFDKDGNQSTFLKHRMSVMCMSPKRFEIAKDIENTYQKLGASNLYAIRTVLTKDQLPAVPEFPSEKVTPEMINGIKQALAIDNLVANLPTQESIAKHYQAEQDAIKANQANLSTPQTAIVITTDCDSRHALYTGPGTSGNIDGNIIAFTPESITIDGTDSATHQNTTIEVKKVLPKRSTDKAGRAAADAADAKGIHTFSISITKKTQLGDRQIEITQSVVDDVSPTVEIDPALLKVYGPSIGTDAKKVDFSKLIAARDALKAAAAPARPDVAAPPDEAAPNDNSVGVQSVEHSPEFLAAQAAKQAAAEKEAAEKAAMQAAADQMAKDQAAKDQAAKAPAAPAAPAKK